MKHPRGGEGQKHLRALLPAVGGARQHGGVLAVARRERALVGVVDATATTHHHEAARAVATSTSSTSSTHAASELLLLCARRDEGVEAACMVQREEAGDFGVGVSGGGEGEV